MLYNIECNPHRFTVVNEDSIRAILAVAVAQLAERQLPNPEGLGSNPLMSIFLKMLIECKLL